MSSPQSIERCLCELVSSGLVERLAEPATTYRCCDDETVIAEISTLAKIYRTAPVRVTEAIYHRDGTAVRGTARETKTKPADPPSRKAH